MTAGKFADEMDFRFLLDPRRKLLSLGFDVETGKLPPACYDLLASEARIAVFAAIAKEDIPQDVWFLLGRAHTREHGLPVLLSWTGTMFEYLMPVLWMRTYPNTLLDNSRIAAVRLQQIYAAEKSVPWGISESAYAKRDEAGNYQYQAFGLPDISLHQGEANMLVISPYSTFLALHVDASGRVAQPAPDGRRGLAGPVRILRGGRLQHRFRPPQLAPSPRTGALLDGPPPGHELCWLWSTSCTMAWSSAGFTTTGGYRRRNFSCMKGRRPTSSRYANSTARPPDARVGAEPHPPSGVKLRVLLSQSPALGARGANPGELCSPARTRASGPT